MKAIILAAWKWTRLKPLTNYTPKPILKIAGKSIIKHNLKHIYKYVDEIIIVVKYLKEKIVEDLWDNYKKVPIKYFLQGDEKGTWAAVKWLDKYFKKDEEALILNWDSIFSKNDLKKIIKQKWYAVLVQKVENPEKYGIFETDKKWFVKKVVEKPEKYIWDLANLWVYKFSSEILKIAKNIKKSKRWEYEITDAINEFITKNKLKTIEIEDKFIDIWYPFDILEANSYFLEKLKKSKIDWKVEKNVVIKWNIILEKWAILKSGTYIEWNCYIWKNSEIWPHTYLRWNTVIWEDCKVWNAVELKNTSIWNNVSIAHLSYFWDSILWNDINIWWGFISANLRHDKKDIKVMIKWELVDSKRKKLWVIIWDNVKTWIKTISMPGRIIDSDSFTMPWEMIK